MRLHRLLLVPACLLVAAAPAAAKPVKYQLTVKGNQVTTWDYAKKQQPTCDWPETESGQQDIEFHTPRARKTTISMDVSRRGAVKISPSPVIILAEAKLRRDYRRLFTRQGPCPGGGVFGGGDGPPKDAVGTARCQVDGGLELRLGGTVQSMFDKADPLRPPTANRAPAGTLFARADPRWSDFRSIGERSLPAMCSFHDQPDADIGITEGEREWSGALIEAKERLPLKRVRKLRRGGTLKVSLGRSVSYPNSAYPRPGKPTTKGRTVMAMNITLKRLSR